MAPNRSRHTSMTFLNTLRISSSRITTPATAFCFRPTTTGSSRTQARPKSLREVTLNGRSRWHPSPVTWRRTNPPPKKSPTPAIRLQLIFPPTGRIALSRRSPRLATDQPTNTVSKSISHLWQRPKLCRKPPTTKCCK